MITNSQRRGQLLLTILLLATTGCVATDSPRRSLLLSSREYLPEPVNPVIVIPGYGNSKLVNTRSGRFVWGTAMSFVFVRHSDDMDLPIENPQSGDSLVTRGFAGSRASFNAAYHLTHALTHFGRYGKNPNRRNYVVAFEYDFRQSHVVSARRLDDLIDELRRVQGDPQLKIDLVAQSAGGLVALTYLRIGTAPLDRPDLWDQASKEASSKIRRVVMLAAPEDGTLEAVRMLHRGEKILLKDIPPEVTTTFPSLFELLPSTGKSLLTSTGIEDFWMLETWEKLRLSIFQHTVDPRRRAAFAARLMDGQRFRQAMLRTINTEVPMLRIGGHCAPTAQQMIIRADGSSALYAWEMRDSEKPLKETMFVPGDGSVTAASSVGGYPRGLQVCSGHHGMSTDPTALSAILTELSAGPGLN